MQDALVVAQLKSVLQETGSLLIAKWGFDAEQHHAYIEKSFIASKTKISLMRSHVSLGHHYVS